MEENESESAAATNNPDRDNLPVEEAGKQSKPQPVPKEPPKKIQKRTKSMENPRIQEAYFIKFFTMYILDICHPNNNLWKFQIVSLSMGSM